MTITDSVVRGNAWGGVFIGGKADAFISTSRIADNRSGGGIEKAGGGTLTLQSCLLSGNTSAQDGGGIDAHWGQLSLVDTTVTGNTAARHGGGIFVVDGTTTVTLDAASSVTGNTPDDCYGTPAC
jgi:predicted outer membrane repeat protein